MVGTENFRYDDKAYQLQYRWPFNYADMFFSPSSDARQAAIDARKMVLDKYLKNAEYRTVTQMWSLIVNYPIGGGVPARPEPPTRERRKSI